MTSDEQAIQYRRLFLEELICSSQRELDDIKRNCKHTVIIHGRIMYSPRQHKVVEIECDLACCALCGKDFGWWCPENPSHYCEYEDGKSFHSYECKWCRQPVQRK